MRVVHKDQGAIRITVDYKPLNKVIVVEKYPIPPVVELYARPANGGYFSKLYMIPVHPNSIKFTAFICEFAKFRERDASKNKSGENNGEIIAAEPSSELRDKPKPSK